LGFAQYEDDKFSGFQSEIEAGLGVGYRVLKTSNMSLSVNAGPGYRIGKLQAPLADEKEIFARGTALFEWAMSDSAKLSNDFSLRWDDERTKIENTLAVTSKLVGNLAARASFNVRHTSNPPRANLKKTDTITKLALVYSF
jgi:putative salt-induced outer membrane protein